jgi:hypothetical protein
MALDGKTSAEVAGIQLKGKDKWLTLIQNAKFTDSRIAGRNVPINPN